MSNPRWDYQRMKMTMIPTRQFQEIRIGQHFEFRGCRYEKLAVNLGRDEDHYGNLFHPQTEVLPDPLGAVSPLGKRMESKPRGPVRLGEVDDDAVGEASSG